MNKTSERIKNRRIRLGLSLQDVADRLDVNKSSVLRWETGQTGKIKLPVIEKLAKVLNTTSSYLMGWDDIENDWLENNAIPFEEVYKLPILGNVSAGNGIIAVEDIIGYETVDSKYANNGYFFLQAKGDSMSPKIDSGDLVLIKKSNSLDNGSIGVFIIDGEEGVLKKVFYGNDFIELHSINPYYPVRRFEGSDILRVQVNGLALEIRKKL